MVTTWVSFRRGFGKGRNQIQFVCLGVIAKRLHRDGYTEDIRLANTRSDIDQINKLEYAKYKGKKVKFKEYGPIMYIVQRAS